MVVWEFPPYYYPGGLNSSNPTRCKTRRKSWPWDGLRQEDKVLPTAPYSLRLVALTGALEIGLAGKGVIQSLGKMGMFRREKLTAK